MAAIPDDLVENSRHLNVQDYCGIPSNVFLFTLTGSLSHLRFYNVLKNVVDWIDCDIG